MSAPNHQPRRSWTSAEEAELRARYPHEPTAALARALDRTVKSLYQRAQALGLRKSEHYLTSAAAGRLQPGCDNPGRAHQFRPGHVPANKGLRHPPGWAPGRMAASQFKPGHIAGKAAQLLLPVGAEVIDPEGYRKRKVRDDAPPNQARKNWAFVHVLVWEAAHGPVPPAHVVMFRNGNKADIHLGNLELITRADLMRRNSIHRYPPELKSTIRAVSQLAKKIRHAEEAIA
ncbi:MAG: HNH endonuclease signature motif containing protein [Hyphomicrobiaceae bacterium]